MTRWLPWAVGAAERVKGEDRTAQTGENGQGREAVNRSALS